MITKLSFIKQNSLERLLANIVSNQDRYAEDSSWLADYFSGSNWSLESNISLAQSITFRLPESKLDHFDLENTRAVYSALKHLTPLQAADPRLWAYMTHVTHWDYMRRRWPVEQYIGKPRFKEIIQERYFFMSDRSRAPLRNGIARLWWYGYCSYDETLDDPFQLTDALLKKLDATQNILENAFGKNNQVTQAILRVLQEREKEGNAFYIREQVRQLAHYIVQIGGVTIVDALDAAELREIVLGKIDQLSSAPVPA